MDAKYQIDTAENRNFMREMRDDLFEFEMENHGKKKTENLIVRAECFMCTVSHI